MFSLDKKINIKEDIAPVKKIFYKKEDMTRLFQKVKLSPSIGRRKARCKAMQKALNSSPYGSEQYRCYDTKPDNCRIYNMPAEPCWFQYVPWADGQDGLMLRSSRVILISKLTGRILYDGPANDEG